ncbi:Cyclin-D1-1 [Senna tora]|uniref:B-like cyclin n=1 Tax=Senna tora TaxID=362788 RepID=A0A834SUV8_9FABA|nr:Cyclin-D1-1 [Senna tora]
MSIIISPEHQLGALDDLYCNEAAAASDDAVSFHSENLPWDSDHEGCVLTLLDSELDQIQDKQKSLAQLRENTCLVSAREEAINWILKVQDYYSFRPETAYLSVNYLDRFLLSHSLPRDRGWPMQLLAVACVAVAAKMEERRVPLLLDLQTMEPRRRVLFKPKTVQRMELLVMATLRWRLRCVTPFDFAPLFVAKLSSSSSASIKTTLNHIISRVSHVINRTCLVTDFFEFRPSTIAAAALLWVIHQYVDEQMSLSCLHQYINTEMVQKCYKLMKKKHKILQSLHFVATEVESSLPPSPTCVLDHAAMQESIKDLAA